LETALSEAGFQVVSTTTAQKAIAEFDVNPTAIGAIVTDIRLGEGMNGRQIARHVRKTVPHMPIIYMSGDSSGDWHAEGVTESV
jgi:DNA-binding response OmpR family regulator